VTVTGIAKRKESGAGWLGRDGRAARGRQQVRNLKGVQGPKVAIWAARSVATVVAAMRAEATTVEIQGIGEAVGEGWRVGECAGGSTRRNKGCPMERVGCRETLCTMRLHHRVYRATGGGH
jgi:hypothetical protein